MRVLLVEDDPDMAAMITHGLRRSGFVVDWVRNGKRGLDRALVKPYALVVLDLMLPEMNGWDVCGQLRAKRRQVPILMVTARNLVDDRVAGLECGADDYLPKPFDFRELLARVRALVRRDRVLRTRLLSFADVEVDTHHRTVSQRGLPVSLTRLEYDIFEILATNCGRTVSRETLLELVWQDREPGSNKVEVAIRSLRRKFDMRPGTRLIHTVHGFGYVLRVEDEAAAT
jgi:DNA-binding response OmpR family regulator